MTVEKKTKKVFVVEWSAPCEEKIRISNRRIFAQDKEADAFMQELTKAATLIGIESVCNIAKVETELN